MWEKNRVTWGTNALHYSVITGLQNPFEISISHCRRWRGMGRRCPENGDPLGSRILSPSSGPRSLLPSTSTLHDARSPHCLDSVQSPSKAWLFKTNRSGQKTMDRNTYGVNDSPILLLQVDVSVIQPPKRNAAASPSPNINLPMKQCAPRSQKRAGAGMTSNRQDQTSYFAPILFRWPSGRRGQQAGYFSRNCYRTRRIESQSPNLSLRSGTTK